MLVLIPGTVVSTFTYLSLEKYVASTIETEQIITVSAITSILSYTFIYLELLFRAENDGKKEKFVMLLCIFYQNIIDLSIHRMAVMSFK